MAPDPPGREPRLWLRLHVSEPMFSYYCVWILSLVQTLPSHSDRRAWCGCLFFLGAKISREVLPMSTGISDSLSVRLSSALAILIAIQWLGVSRREVSSYRAHLCLAFLRPRSQTASPMFLHRVLLDLSPYKTKRDQHIVYSVVSCRPLRDCNSRSSTPHPHAKFSSDLVVPVPGTLTFKSILNRCYD